MTESDNFQNRKNAKLQIPLHLTTSLNQGSWVAVAYADDFFIGTVLEVTSAEVGTI